MGFVVKQPKTIDLEVVVKIPASRDCPGGLEQKFTVTANYLTVAERQAFWNKLGGDENTAADVDALEELIVDWSGVRSEEGQDLPFNRSNLETMLNIPCVYDAIIKTVLDEYYYGPLSGLLPHIRKN